MVIEKIDSFGKVGWIAVTFVAFWLAWPIGLMLIAYLAGSGRLQSWRTSGMAAGTWFNLRNPTAAAQRGWRAPWASATPAPSGNKAFDEYRDATISRLEEEQQEFQSYLERLRQARDKAEFDAFMAERRQRGAGADSSDAPSRD